MKKILLVVSLLLISSFAFSQAFVKGTGIRYDRGVPTVAPDTTYGTEYVIDLENRTVYMWDRTNEGWVKQLNITRAAGNPSTDPGDGPDLYENTSSNDLYWWSGSSWDQVNGGGGSTSMAADSVTVTASGNLTSTNAQDAFEELQSDIDGLSSGGVPDGAKGDITVSSSGAVWNVDEDAEVLTTETTRTRTYNNNAGSGQYWGDYGNYFNNAERFPLSVTVKANGAGTVRLAFMIFNGSTATVRKTSDHAISSGDNEITIDTTGLSLSDTSMYLGLAQVSGNVVSYASISPNGNAYFVNTSTLAITNTSSFEFGYTVKWRHKDGVLAGIHALSGEIDDALVEVDNKIDSIAVYTGRYPAGTSWSHTYINTLLTTYSVVTLPEDTITITGTILVPAGKTLRGLGGRSVIKTTTTTINCVQLQGDNATVKNFTIIGSANYDPTATTEINSEANIESRNGIGGQVGIYITGALECVISEMFVFDMTGSGMFIRSTVGTNYTGGASISGCQFRGNYIGADFHTQGEYNTLVNCRFTENVVGLWSEAGNNYYSTCNISSNRVGVVCADRGGSTGSNNSHSSLANSAINHNEYIGIYGFDFDFGFFFSNCEIWATTSGDGVVMNDCIGFNWVGGYITRDLSFKGSGYYTVAHARHSTVNTVTTTGTATYNGKNNYQLDGTASGGMNN